MEGNLLAGEFEKLGAVRSNRTASGQAGVSASCSSASGFRCTRSHGAPEWSVQDMLILVNEIIAVEGDCKNALSSYQKWTIVAENCTALDVPRNSNQCRRKWDSLVADYKTIADWEFKSHGNSYWSLDHERRKWFRLPLDFNEELYQAVDILIKVQQERSDTDPDSDPEAYLDVLDAMEAGSKKSRRRAMPAKGITKPVAIPAKGVTEYVSALQTKANEDKMKEMHVVEEEHVANAGHESSKKTRHRATPQKEDHLEKAVYGSSKKTRRGAALQKGIPDHVASPHTARSKYIMNEGYIAKPAEDSYKKTGQQAIPQKGITQHTAIPRTGHDEEIMGEKHVVEEEHVAEVAHGTSKKSWCQATLQMGITESIPIPPKGIAGYMTNLSIGSRELIMKEKSVLVEEHVAKAGHGSWQKSRHQAILQEETIECVPAPQTRTTVPVVKVPCVAEEDDKVEKATMEEREGLLGEKLLQNARLIDSILSGNMTGNVDDGLFNLKNEEALKTEEARHKAEKLISYFEVLNRNLGQLISVVEECQDHNN